VGAVTAIGRAEGVWTPRERITTARARVDEAGTTGAGGAPEPLPLRATATPAAANRPSAATNPSRLRTYWRRRDRLARREGCRLPRALRIGPPSTLWASRAIHMIMSDGSKQQFTAA